MGSLFRSEEMTLAQLYLQAESAYYCISELGELGLVQFRDLNPAVNAFQRKYVNEVRRCDEMERRLRYLEKEIEKAEIPISDTGEVPDAPPPANMIELETQFDKLEAEIREINTNQERLNRNFLELTELKHILWQTANFFEEAESAVQYGGDFQRSDDEAALLDEARTGSSPLSFVAGVISRDRMPTFERLLWRACRGNVFLRSQEIDGELKDPVTGDAMHKCVFIIFFQGDQLRSRVKKICEGFRATQYPCPDTAAERREMAMGVATRIEDLSTVLSQTLDHRFRVLQAIAKNIHSWTIKVNKIKAIYHTLNLLNVDVTQKCLIGECWCPVTDLDEIQFALRRGHERSGSSVMPILNVMASGLNPPTYNKVNKFTRGFQNIIDAYGVASYREVNPAPFSIITFPFLFAVMFGDCGHGMVMFLFALAFIIKEKELTHFKGGGEIFGTFFSGRYIILLMGAFSMYTGIIYNDCFSKSFNIFGSSWTLSNITVDETSPELVNLNVSNDFSQHNPYPFGLDPVWQIASNKLTFTNSYKMKMSVTLGVMQMMFGVILSLFNHVFFRRHINIIGSFIPEVLFLGGIFGYLVFMIFYKWIAIEAGYHSRFPGTPLSPEPTLGPGPPSLLIMLINMFLSFGSVPLVEQFYPGQAVVQSLLVVIAVIAVPWMLLMKPIYLVVKHKQKGAAQAYVSFNEDDEGSSSSVQDDDQEQVIQHSEHGGGDEPFSVGDIFVHQGIHTIEFCLGCISNTASYLRLWALSLAHAELSEVLWNMMFKIGLSWDKGPMFWTIFVTWVIWAALTIAILLIMEGLSAFLHALRLHWVEFNNKFYQGEGYKFQPFSFALILEGGADE